MIIYHGSVKDPLFAAHAIHVKGYYAQVAGYSRLYYGRSVEEAVGRALLERTKGFCDQQVWIFAIGDYTPAIQARNLVIRAAKESKDVARAQ